ncbi:MAG: acetyl-CoA acetyltransferase [Candidatus Entotheonella factor]|uniref:Acetyl-CoA acetyltransferase n=1 Tax=Entotheonella factor TaxID=1429438 RepID=W4LSN6_ENTF1|nr:MAG: acetyl-CoA acetyltransferase [Candidatus Entotheonella factor]
MPGPLDGIRVIDMTTVLLGPYGTQILGDMGADVIKVEAPPTGDIARNMGAVRNPGMGGSYLNVNRNKRSIALDLKQDEAKAVLQRLIPTADVFVHNMRPQAIGRLGFSYEAVAGLKPDIVYVGAYGYGQQGPYRSRPAYDDAIQAASGLASLFKRQDGQARYVPATVADKIVGLTLSQAVAMALVHKERTGEGQFVEVPMLETLVSFNLVEHINGGAYDPPIGKMGYQRVVTSARRPFPTKDGYVCILPYNDKQWLNFFTVVGRPEMMEDPRFATYPARVHTIDELYGFIASVTPEKTTAEWVEICEQAEIPSMPVVDIEDLMEDEHLQAVGMFEKHHHPSEGDTVLVRPPVQFSKSPGSIRRHAPGFGEHGMEVLRELGYDEVAIAEMQASGALITEG